MVSQVPANVMGNYYDQGKISLTIIIFIQMGLRAVITLFSIKFLQVYAHAFAVHPSWYVPNFAPGTSNLDQSEAVSSEHNCDGKIVGEMGPWNTWTVDNRDNWSDIVKKWYLFYNT